MIGISSDLAVLRWLLLFLSPSQAWMESNSSREPTKESIEPVRKHWEKVELSDIVLTLKVKPSADEFLEAIKIRGQFARLFLGTNPYFRRPEDVSTVQGYTDHAHRVVADGLAE